MAHKPNHPKTRVTSSRTRNKGTAKTPVSGAKPSSRANRSKVSTAKVTSEAKTRPSGARGIFEKSNPKVTKGAGTAIARLKAANRVALPLAIMGQTADVVDGFQKLANHPFIKGRPKPATPKPAAPKGPTPAQRKDFAAQETKARQALTARKKAAGSKEATPNTAASFDDAFRDARRAKVKTFTWRGKKYTTEMK
jgi:hypothetical protein